MTTEERQSLAADHVEWARRIAARTVARMPFLADEAESAALLAIVEASRSFDPTRGIAFTTHATHRIVGAIKDAMRNSAPQGYRRRASEAPSVVSLDRAIDGPDDSGESTFRDVLPEMADGSEPVGWEAEYQDELAALGRRTGAAGRVIPLLYGRADASLMHLAGRNLGLSMSRVSQMHTQAIGELRHATRLGETEGDMDEAGTNGHATTNRVEELIGAEPPTCFQCGGEKSRCGRGYRCLACQPIERVRPKAKARSGGPPEPARGEAGPTPTLAVLAGADDVLAELDAMRGIAGLLAPLDGPARGRVLAWIAGRFGSM